MLLFCRLYSRPVHSAGCRIQPAVKIMILETAARGCLWYPIMHTPLHNNAVISSIEPRPDEDGLRDEKQGI